MSLLIRSAYVVLLISVFSVGMLGQTWQPVSQSELQMDKSQVEADADAEVLFWEVRLVDKYSRSSGWDSVLNHHLRIKIFTERGRESNSKVDIPFGNVLDADSKVVIKDIAARTIKPDGTVIELQPGDIFERTIVKGSGVKLKAKSFAVPGIETGAIIEYRWKEVREVTFNYTRLIMARDIPVQFVKYYVKPADVPLSMKIHSLNTSGDMVDEKNGFYSTTMTNVPSFKEEPRIISEYDVKPWVLVYYDSDTDKYTPEEYWKKRGKKTFAEHKNLLKPTSEIKGAMLKAVGDAAEPEEKIRRVFEYCRQNIRDSDDDTLTDDARRNIKANKTTTDTLKNGIGDWHDTGMVFAAMLNAAGFDARVANVSTRTDAAFNKKQANDYFVRTEVIAVKVGETWRFYDFSDRNLPFGMISWKVEGQPVLISDSDAPVWERIPVSASAQSNTKRVAKMRLDETGSLEGEVRIEYTGHLAAFFREYNDDDAPAEREKSLIEMMRRQIGANAQLGNIIIENLSDPGKPFVYSFRMRVPSYAERTGKRIFLRPNIFKRSAGAMFASSERKYDVAFDYPWSETDEISFETPEGFSAESFDAPKILNGERTGSRHESKITFTDNNKILTYQRNFRFGKTDALVFYSNNYSSIKAVFDAFYGADSLSLVLKEDSPKTN